MSEVGSQSNALRKMVFMGSHPIALPVLKALRHETSEKVEICGVVTQPDRRTGRGMKVEMNPIKKWALVENIPLFQPEKADDALEKELKDLGCEMILVMAYGQILRRSLIELPRFGTLNLHASLLPKLRGASPLHTAIAEGDSESGVTLMRIVPKMDAGPIIDQEKVSIGDQWTTDDLAHGVADACVPLVLRQLDSWCSGNLSEREQEEAEVSYCRIISKGDGVLDFSESSERLAARIRAFQPWPGTAFEVNEQEIKIRSARFDLDDHDRKPGEFEIVDGKQLVIYCGKGRLWPTQLQRAGAKNLPVDAFLRGFDMGNQGYLTSRVMPSLVGKTARWFGKSVG